MKKALKTMMLAAVLSLTGCVKSPEEMLVGRWKLDCAREKVSVEGSGTVSVDTLQGYDTQEIQFLEDATCLLTDRGETTMYHWSFTDKYTLALWREGWAEDYTVNILTDQRLVYSDSYIYYDSVDQCRKRYAYIFEYKKL